jgi:ferritin-like metal-binding protein YciE
MATETLRDLCDAEFQDLYDAEQKIASALPTFITLATFDRLKNVLARHLEQCRIHLERLELLFNERDLPTPVGRASPIAALIQDAERRMQSMREGDVRDAALIAAAQLIAHYEIAAYGCACAYSDQLGDAEAARLLQQTLEDEHRVDRDLTNIATTISALATLDSLIGERHPSRLRYAYVGDLDEARQPYASRRIRNAIGEDVGRIDGLLIDTAGRVLYVVVAPSTLFVGRRYLVPLDRINLDHEAGPLTDAFDRQTLKQHPEFHADTFAQLTEEESRRFGWHAFESVTSEEDRSSSSD